MCAFSPYDTDNDQGIGAVVGQGVLDRVDQVNIAAVAIMLKVLIEMGIESINEWKTALILLSSFGFTFGMKKSNAMITVLLGSLFGWSLSFA